MSVFSPWSAVAADLTPDDLRRLGAGETLVHMAPAPAVEGWAAREVALPAERLARAAGDWRHYAEFFPFVERSEVTVEDGAVVARQTIASRLLPRRRLVATVEQERRGPPGRRTWTFRWRSAEGGEGGEWTLVELAPGRARVELRLRGGLGLPAAFARPALERTLGWALDGLAQQANRCRYDLPRHPTCPEAPPFASASAAPSSP